MSYNGSKFASSQKSKTGSETVIKTGVLCKRSISKKKAFCAQNYKSRLFQLTGYYLYYYEGDIGNCGKLKGSVLLSAIKVVMEVENELLEGRSNVFQIVYENRKDFLTLYVIADSPRIQKEWITAIREAAVQVGAQFFQKYHPGVWTKKLGYYNCCNQSNRNAMGCKCDAIVAKIPPPPIPPPRPDTSSSPRKVVIAKFDYEPMETKDLELIQGDTYTILDDTIENWWMAENSNGVTGYIPANYVAFDIGLEVYEWYYKTCTREDSKQILMASHKEGCFLVRDSVSSPGNYTLSIFTSEGGGSVRYYQIKSNEMNQFYIAQNHAFSNIPDLIYYHKHNAGGIHTRLREPPPRGNKPTTAGFGYGKWELNAKDLTIGSELGRGCFGVVYAGIYKRGRTHKHVAVKEMPFNPGSDEFLQEFKTMTQLQHPNIVQLYGAIEKNKKQQIVTELLVNGALNTYLQNNRDKLKYEQNQLLHYCTQVCNGMEYLDSKQIIHRDLAARNCLVGTNETVKVGDFGLARMVLTDDEYQMSDGSKFPFKWAPPEVLHHRTFSSKSDVWAYGILMWEIYTFGEMPYSGMKNAEVAKFVAEDKRRLNSPRAATRLIYEIMMQCWHEGPLSRPTFTQLKAKLAGLNAKGDYMPT